MFSFSLNFGNLKHVKNNINGGNIPYIPYSVTVKYPTTKASTNVSLLNDFTLLAIVTSMNIVASIIKFILRLCTSKFICVINSAYVVRGINKLSFPECDTISINETLKPIIAEIISVSSLPIFVYNNNGTNVIINAV